mmetsp:Transcript_79549/g.221336  ORF Transcript_79549/g.221336 Transcript_79549/m.221336 type:complete len:291 (-) Transcript_79549:34-906(-)
MLDDLLELRERLALQRRSPCTSSEKVDVADAQEGWRDAARDRTRFAHHLVGILRPPHELLDKHPAHLWREMRKPRVVHVGQAFIAAFALCRRIPRALDCLAFGHNERQRTRRRHAERVHRLRSEELTDRRAEYRAPIRATAKWRGPTAFQLQLPAPTRSGRIDCRGGARASASRDDHLGDRDGAAVAVTVAVVKRAVARHWLSHDRERVGRAPGLETARRQDVAMARKETHEIFAHATVVRQPELSRHCAGVDHQPRTRQWCWLDADVMPRLHLPRHLVWRIRLSLGVWR